MRYIALALSLVAGTAFAQQPNGIINAPIYATGYISVAGGTNVATKIPAQPNHPANQNVYLTSAVTGTWTIQLPNPAFEGQVLSFNCGAAANAISITSSDGSSIDSNLPTSCAANGGFVTQFDLRSNIWRSLGSLLGLAQTWSANQTFNSGNFLLAGSTSGTLTVKPAATAGSNTLTLPAGTTDFSATGGTNQVVQQTSVGGAFTVGQLSGAALSAGALANGMTATTQTAADNSTKLATTAYVDSAISTTGLTSTTCTLTWTGGPPTAPTCNISYEQIGKMLYMNITVFTGTALNGATAVSVTLPNSKSLLGAITIAGAYAGGTNPAWLYGAAANATTMDLYMGVGGASFSANNYVNINGWVPVN